MLCTAVAGVGGRRLGWLCGAWAAKPTLHCTPWGPRQPQVNSRFPGQAQARLGTPGVAKRTRSRRESRLVVTILAAAQAAGSLFGFGAALPGPHSNACLPSATDTSTTSLSAACLHGPRFSCAGRTGRVLQAAIITKYIVRQPAMHSVRGRDDTAQRSPQRPARLAPPAREHNSANQAASGRPGGHVRASQGCTCRAPRNGHAPRDGHAPRASRRGGS
jgi:hypothetical protein